MKIKIQTDTSSAGRWVRILTESMDLIALAALFSTGEISTRAWQIVAGFYVLRFIPKLRFKPFWIIVSFVFAIFATLWLYFSLRYAPIVAVAHMTPIIHVCMALVNDKNRLRGWRIGVGFIELIIASALSPEFLLPILVFAFIVVGSVNVSCRFLQEELEKHEELSDAELPKNFIRRGLSQALLLFVSAAVIFPILPRMAYRSGSGGVGANSSPQTGYAEEVGLTEWTKFSENSSNSTALRICTGDVKDVSNLIPFGLLRARVLPIFDGKNWAPTNQTGEISDSRLRDFPHDIETTPLNIVRETIGSTVLPSPYGTLQTTTESMGMSYTTTHTLSAEWMEPRSRNQRISYQVNIVPFESFKEYGLPYDKPKVVHLYVPERYKNTRIEKLAETLFSGLEDPRKKVEQLIRFFSQERFTAYMGEDLKSGEEVIFSEKNSKMTTLEYFLFEKKKGHCELFASSMALLLRMGGVPTRLISGFRISRWAVGDVLTVRMNDAHAWLEYYKDGVGWFPLDPTPKLLTELSVVDWVRDGYDWMSGKWYQYILSYGEDPSVIESKWDSIKSSLKKFINTKGHDVDDTTKRDLVTFVVLFALVSGLLTVGVLRLYRVRRKTTYRIDGPAVLRLEKHRFETLLRKNGFRAEGERRQYVKPELQSKIESWKYFYSKLRFGKPSAAYKKDLSRLRDLRKEVQQDLKEAS